MNSVVMSKTLPEPPVCKREILRYSGCREETDGLTALVDSCLAEAAGCFSCRVCYCELPLTVTGEDCDLGAFRLRSKDLAANLQNCGRVLLFAATVGVGIDRLIARYSRSSPSRALILQALGAERIEALCDAFCAGIEQSTAQKLTPRFSPGYGDLPLEIQTDIFALLGCEKRIGLFLGDSLLMSPSKSVTAFAGLGGGRTDGGKTAGL